MNILVFDTETTSINKPFCYNVGYIIYNVESDSIVLKRDYVIEQVWHNLPLFSTAYYAEKRALYVGRLRTRQIKLEKFGYACQQMIRDIKNYNVQFAYAYNSNFDERVFAFNCDWFKCCNPFELIPVLDIRGNVHKTIVFTELFQKFCETNKRFTDNGNYSTTAETVFQFIQDDTEFQEEHTAVADSEIELQILIETINRGCEWGESYKVYNSIVRTTLDTLPKTHTLTFTYNGITKTYKYIRRKNKGTDNINIESEDYKPE